MKVRFFYHAGGGNDVEEIVDFPPDTPEQEIIEQMLCWLEQKTYAGYEIVEEGE